jgi:hypothetical protein
MKKVFLLLKTANGFVALIAMKNTMIRVICSIAYNVRVLGEVAEPEAQ